MGGAVAAALLIPGLAGLAAAAFFVLMGLLWLARPFSIFGSEGGQTGRIYKIANIMLGIGLGSIAGLLVAFLPSELFWPIMGIAFVAILVWSFMQR
jgi:hypothetical protein